MRTLLIALMMTLATQAGADDAKAFVNSVKQCWVLLPSKPQSHVTIKVNVRFDEEGQMIPGSVEFIEHNSDNSEDAKLAFQA